MKSLKYVTNYPGRTSLLLLLLSSWAPCAAADKSYDLGGSVRVGSDYTFRGVSQTMGNHAIQVSVDLGLPSGLYAYAWWSNVDFIPEGEPDDGATHEVDLAIGYATDIAENWRVDFTLVRYLFPGTFSDVDYDYNELMASVWYANTYGATVAYTADVDGTGADSTLLRLTAGFDLSTDTTFEASYGYFDLSDAYESAYTYLEVELARSIGNTEIALAYVDTSQSAETIYSDQANGRRFVLSLQVDW